jgi:hypothetical protein
MGYPNQDFCDYYYILQVHHNAEPEIVKSAYRRLVQMNHPDHNPDPKAVSKMQLINQAYEVFPTRSGAASTTRNGFAIRRTSAAPKRCAPDIRTTPRSRFWTPTFAHC